MRRIIFGIRKASGGNNCHEPTDYPSPRSHKVRVQRVRRSTAACCDMSRGQHAMAITLARQRFPAKRDEVGVGTNEWHRAKAI